MEEIRGFNCLAVIAIENPMQGDEAMSIDAFLATQHAIVTASGDNRKDAQTKMDLVGAYAERMLDDHDEWVTGATREEVDFVVGMFRRQLEQMRTAKEGTPMWQGHLHYCRRIAVLILSYMHDVYLHGPRQPEVLEELKRDQLFDAMFYRFPLWDDP